MNLNLFFQPIDSDLYPRRSGSGKLGQEVQTFFDTFPDYKMADVAIIYCPENRGNFDNHHTDVFGHTWRKALYNLSRLEAEVHIVDMGMLRSGETLEDTYDRLREVCTALHACGTLPLIVGGSHDLALPQYQGLAALHDMLSIVSMDAEIDMQHELDSDEASAHALKIIQQQPNHLYNFTHLAYQSFHTDYEMAHLLEKLNFDHVRLGRMRDDFGKIEPLLRAADLWTVDMNALRWSDFPARNKSGFFGLSAEEACQLAWYAGLSPSIKTAGFYEYNPDMDQTGQSGYVLATMIWYFLEGWYHKKPEADFQSNQYLKFLVEPGSSDAPIVFYKNKFNQRWWMEVHYQTEVREEIKIVPCDRSDYDQAASGQLPDSYIKALNRMQG